MTEAEVRRLMFAEVCSYRPCAEGKSGNVSRWGTNLGAKGGAGVADAKGQSDAGIFSGKYISWPLFMLQYLVSLYSLYASCFTSFACSQSIFLFVSDAKGSDAKGSAQHK